MQQLPKLALVIAGNFSADEDNADPNLLLNYLPQELALRCEIKEWSCQPSSHYSMAMTLAMEQMFESLADDGYGGIIVVSGSGVMEEMAYLVDLLWQRPIPVIFANLMVQGRAGVKEGLMNLHCAVRAALSGEAREMGALICSSGELFAADEVRLVDPVSSDNAFQAPEKGSLGKMLNSEIKFFRAPKRPGFLARKPAEMPCVEILWASLGGGDLILAQLAAARDLGGLVLAGFGAGNVPPLWIPQIRNIIRRRIPVAVVSRCFQGDVHKTNEFEGSFEKLLEMGVMSGGRLNPFQARIRMSLGIAAGLTDNGLSLYMLGQQVSDDINTLYK
ncbi:MAG: asparaginase domain-containing protein [Cloacibacillus sp.]